MQRVEVLKTHMPAGPAARADAAETVLEAVRREVRGARVLADLNRLREFGSAGVAKGVVRPALSDADVQARRWLAEQMRGAGLVTTTDGLGTVFGRNSAPGPALLMGSHSDTQPTGGWLDGSLGVIYALEAARALRAAGVPGAWEVVSWQDEEGRFGALVGSSAFTGRLPEGTLESDALKSARAKHGLEGTAVAKWNDAGRSYIGYLEAHIEQGAQLERKKLSLGVVDSICGMRMHRVTFEGRQNHAGTTRMEDRRDAALAMMHVAARIDTAFRRICAGHPAAVWTIGQAEVLPGASSIVPGKAAFSLQFRDPTDTHLDVMEKAMLRICADADGSPELGGVRVAVGQPRMQVPATALDAGLVRDVEAAAEAVAPGMWQRMPSSAIHDAAPLSSRMPAAMLFVPSIGGISHAFDEDTSDEHLVAGAEAFAVAAARALLRHRSG
eukprot:TRINITY_DN14725_c0_g1_i1.p1 TRINITY_DN14725_c0_g1~~TRINITY_DN14725_c0_g1_i1.p1  ORF type:complete len:442 (+),score=133.66 TRINITY_DN14725_c0_g1_i1:80-1405(+)